MRFDTDEEARKYGYFMDPSRFDDLDRATDAISQIPLESDIDLPPASFRADTVAVIASMLGTGIGKIEMTDEEILEADRIIFRGGQTKWLGLEIETRPLFEDFITDTNPSEEIKSTEIGKYIHDTMEGVGGPAPWRRGEVEDFKGDDTTEGQYHSLAGKLLRRVLKHGPSEQVRDEDLTLLMEHYETTGQILLGTNDQFVDNGDAEKGLMTFLLLQLHESEQAIISQTTNSAGNILVKYYGDGSRKTEMYKNNDNSAKIIFESPNEVVSFGDRRAEEPIATVVAGYEKMSRIPYLPEWMRDSEAAAHPTSAILTVFPDYYMMVIKN